MRSYITSFINQLNLVLNDVYSSENSLDGIIVPTDQSNKGTTNPPTRNDQTTRNDHENGTNLNKKISGRDDPCDSGEVVATSTSKAVLFPVLLK